MLGVISLGGGTIYDYYFPCENSGSRGSPIFLAIMGLLVIISGFANTFVLKPKQKMGNKASFWIACMHLKLLIGINLIFYNKKLLYFLVRSSDSYYRDLLKTQLRSQNLFK